MFGSLNSAYAKVLLTLTVTPTINALALVNNSLKITNTRTIDDEGDNVAPTFKWWANRL